MEQVAHELPVRFPDQPNRQLVTESIYQAIYDSAVLVTRLARRRRRRRRWRVQGLGRRGRLTAMTMIAERPAEVAERVQVGHWEGDCIMGAGNRSAVGALVERTTRFLILVHVPTGRPTADAMRAGIVEALGPAPRAVAADVDLGSGQGARDAPGDHRRGVFCHVQPPWQHVSNENTNGSLRDYFPKGRGPLGRHSHRPCEGCR